MQNPRRGIVLTPEDFRGVDWIKRSSELGLNTLGLHNGEGIGNNTISRLEMATTSDFQKSATKAGLDYEYELHTMATLLPRELFDAHPEYFVYDEQRKARIPNYNFCPTNGDALEIVTKNAVRCAEILRPTTHRYFFWSDDNMPWCSCKTCKELSSSEQELLVANRICEALRKSCDPLAQVAFLAYHRTLDTPQNIKPSPGVFLEFAPIARSLASPIADPNNEANRQHWETLLKLLELFPVEQTHVLEYWLDSSLVSQWKKPAKELIYNAKVVESDLRAYRDLGIQSVTTFAVYLDGTYFSRYGDEHLLHYCDKVGEIFS